MTKLAEPTERSTLPLVKILRGGLLTLPAATRRKLGLKDGDYVEAVEVEEGVLLKPVALVDRLEAWQRVMEIVRRDKWIGPEPRPTPEEEEQWIFDVLAEDRQRRHG